MAGQLRLGLVLAGGGAKAAYQAGVIRAIARLPVDIVAISAVGAGALNGAVLAASPSNGEAANTLEKIWEETVLSSSATLRLGPLPVLKLGTYLTLLFCGGVESAISESIQKTIGSARHVRAMSRNVGPNADDSPILQSLDAIGNVMNVSVDERFLKDMSNQFKAMASRPIRDFYVSVLEVDNGIIDAFMLVLSRMGMIDGGVHRCFEVSDVSRSAEERVSLVLASATLPFICEAGAIDGKRCVDGSLPGIKAPGAVPLSPLRRRRDLDAIIVVHTESGVTWDATDFVNVPILEMRPSMSEKNADVSYFWAAAGALHRWIELGDKDTTRALSALLDTLDGWQRSGRTHAALRKLGEALD